MNLSRPSLPADPRKEPLHIADWIEVEMFLSPADSLSAVTVIDALESDPPSDAGAVEERSSLRDGYDALVSAALDEIRRRSQILGDNYPVVTDGDIVVFAKMPHLHDVFQFLVLLRARQLYPELIQEDGNESGLLFEEIVKYAVAAFLNTDQSLRFGLGGGHRGDGLSTELHGAVNEVATRMGEQTGNVPNKPSHDFGCDVIAWKPFGDLYAGQLVILAQATISEGDWLNPKRQPAKRWTHRQPRQDRLINFIAQPITAIAFVETLSQSDISLLATLSDFTSIPLDRLRLFALLNIAAIPHSLVDDVRSWNSSIVEKLT